MSNARARHTSLGEVEVIKTLARTTLVKDSTGQGHVVSTFNLTEVAPAQEPAAAQEPTQAQEQPAVAKDEPRQVQPRRRSILRKKSTRGRRKSS